MKKLIKITLVIIIFLGLISLFNQVYAASASIKASNTSIKSGESTTISVSVSKTETYNLKMSASGGTLSGTTSGADAFGEEQSKTVLTATFKPNKAGTYKISLSGEIAGSDLKKKSVGSSVTITVKSASTSSSNNSNSNSNSSSNNSNSNSSSNSSSKPNTTRHIF